MLQKKSFFILGAGVLLLQACQTTSSSDLAVYDPYSDLPKEIPQNIPKDASAEQTVDLVLDKALKDVPELPQQDQPAGFTLKMPDGTEQRIQVNPGEPRQGNLPENKLGRISQDPFYKPKVMKYKGKEDEGYRFSSYNELDKTHPLEAENVPTLEVIAPKTVKESTQLLSYGGDIPIKQQGGIQWLSVAVVNHRDHNLAAFSVNGAKGVEPTLQHAQYLNKEQLEEFRDRMKTLIELDDEEQLPPQNRDSAVKLYRTADQIYPYRVVLKQEKQEFMLSQQSMLRLSDFLSITQNKLNSQYKIIVK